MKTDVNIFWVTEVTPDGIETLVTAQPWKAVQKMEEIVGLPAPRKEPFDQFRDMSLHALKNTDFNADFELVEVEVDEVEAVRECPKAKVFAQFDEQEFIEHLEDTERYRVIETANLFDQMKAEWLAAHISEISIEQLENLVK